MNKGASAVVHGPVITERTYQLYSDPHGARYTFRVAKDASKTEIKRALEEQYPNVNVVAVNTIAMHGKKRRAFRRGGPEGATSNWKKAIVRLKPGQKIEGLFGAV